jgi:hypothetical protein
MSNDSTSATSQEILGQLERLIEAIDRRVPHPERPTEAAIARDATELRERAKALMRVMAQAEAKNS